MTIQKGRIYMYMYIYSSMYTPIYMRRSRRSWSYTTLSIWDSIVYTFSMERFIVYDTHTRHHTTRKWTRTSLNSRRIAELEQKSQARVLVAGFDPLKRTPWTTTNRRMNRSDMNRETEEPKYPELSRTDFRITAGRISSSIPTSFHFCHWFFLLPIFRHIFANFCRCRCNGQNKIIIKKQTKEIFSNN